MNFWQTLPKPFFTVAPMADVTDVAFRRLIAKYSGRAQGDTASTVNTHNHFVTWTEFVSADGLVRATPEGRAKLMADLLYSESERPIVAQLFTGNTEHMEYATSLCRELGFDGVDINMGCPDRSIEKQGCGSAMIKTPELARQIIRASKRGAKNLPVSVKTRIGYSRDELEDWLPVLLAEEPAVVVIHARTRRELSRVPANWQRVARAVEIRNELKSKTLIIGNGDVLSLEDGRQKAILSGADGIMVGRALFGNPWFFNSKKRLPVRLTALPTHGVDRDSITMAEVSEDGVEYVTTEERLRVLVEHSKLFVSLLPHKNFSIMKKHFKAYVNSFPGASELRSELMLQDNVSDVEGVVERFLYRQGESA